MPRMDKLSMHATTIVTDDEGFTVVTYHATAIVKFNADVIKLNMGGWDTVTTRRKMAQTAAQFRLPFTIYRVNGQTLVRSTLDGEARELNATGRVILPRRVNVECDKAAG